MHGGTTAGGALRRVLAAGVGQDNSSVTVAVQPACCAASLPLLLSRITLRCACWLPRAGVKRRRRVPRTYYNDDGEEVTGAAALRLHSCTCASAAAVAACRSPMWCPAVQVVEVQVDRPAVLPGQCRMRHLKLIHNAHCPVYLQRWWTGVFFSITLV